MKPKALNSLTKNLLKSNFVLYLFVFIQSINAQVGIETTSPEAALDIASTNAGVLLPRFSLASINDTSVIINPNGGAIATGTLIFNDGLGALSTVGFYFWNGTNWSLIGASSNERRSVHFESVNTTTDLQTNNVVRIPLFGTQIFNDDTSLFTVQSDDATIQLNEAGRYRITVNIFLFLDEAEGLDIAVYDVNGPAGIGNLVTPSRNARAGAGNPEVTFGGNNFVTQRAVASLNLTTVLEFSAGDRFCIGAIESGTVNAGFVPLLPSGSGQGSNIIVEKIN